MRPLAAAGSKRPVVGATTNPSVSAQVPSREAGSDAGGEVGSLDGDSETAGTGDTSSDI
jgi:hypothetical protein